MKNSRCRAILFAALFVVAKTGLAVQEFSVKDGDTISIKMSSKELTRIAVAGNGRLEKVWGSVGSLEIQADKEQGEIFVRPMPGAQPALSFFVRDDLGATYTIVAQQYDIPSETVLLKPKAAAVAQKGIQSNGRSVPHVEAVKKLMRDMALAHDAGYDIENVGVDVPIWRETKIRLVKKYSSLGYLGEIYQLTNVADKAMTFHEHEFFEFGRNVQAVAMELLTLVPGEMTTVYVVRGVEERE